VEYWKETRNGKISLKIVCWQQSIQLRQSQHFAALITHGQAGKNKAFFTSTKINSDGWLHHTSVRDCTTIKKLTIKHPNFHSHSWWERTSSKEEPRCDGTIHPADRKVTTLLSFEEQILSGLPAIEWCNPNGKYYRKQNYTDLLY